MADLGASSISVAVRVRPFTLKEAAQITKCDPNTLFLGDGSMAGAPTPKLGQKGIRPVIKVLDDKCLIFDPPEDNPVQRFSRSVVPNMGKRVKDQQFAFDRVFDENTTQAEVYESTTRGLMDSVMDGYNATVFAYGATGCGKTHTITGTAQQPGIIFLTMQELFEKIAERSDQKQTEITLSYLEIYNETIRDLLVPGGSKQGLMLREDANQAVSVAGLTSHRPRDVQEVMDMIVQGNEYRTVSPTAANATSSRSHAVLQINVAQKDRNADVNEPHTMATLSIIDLAGSERASATKNRGERLLEGANINKSLLALGGCINALCDPRKKNHVPYRNSKLTRLLKFSLGGNCKTVMIVCVSPSSAHFDETQNTLRYANRAKNIQTKVTRNVYNVNRHVKDFLVKIDEQRALITELQAQLKDGEGVAFVKFKKQTEKRDCVARDGIVRIRAAYDNSGNERSEKVLHIKKLRQIERRIAVLSAWVAAFDTICDSREDEDMPPSLTAMRKTAQGILFELENSRQHYHQRLDKMNWERALDSALQNSIKQLSEIDGNPDGLEAASLTREAELLKANASREALREGLDQEKVSDAANTQVLLAAQFDMIASLHDILSMTEEDAVQHAKVTLGRLLQTCSTSVSHIIKPDGSLDVTEKFPPTKRGTPKRKKIAHFLDGQARPVPVMPALSIVAPQVFSSPMKSSPRRRKMGMGKKGISFTPKKKSPSKIRGVRWRDDTEAGGPLADFEKTPQKIISTPEVSSIEESIVIPALPSYLATDAANDSNGSLESSPIPTAPQSSLDAKPKANRFQAGFLSKKSDGSPPPLPPKMTRLSGSDSETSPLRSIDAANRPSLNIMHTVAAASNDSGNNSSSEAENSIQMDRSESAKIGRALKRAGSISRASNDTTARTHRRRSPTAASVSGSPPNENMFTASHARRMVKSDKEGSFHSSVLSPRTQPIMKAGTNRRTTIAEPRPMSGGAINGHMRVASGTPRARESMAGAMGRGGWR
ncbi:P-loop containing nucleoside triphosphate hydrolase protein [Amylocarpus encephaloides]|uniref:Kinesin-like protein n=1 Tax=Amylocarpus encephaloides TaxID=45428 RepID=A0A9P8C6P5_9HELO|nr:P-loop containing nucleoside triphosphate hydrolase protein [Amylocarpus encephaloides]